MPVDGYLEVVRHRHDLAAGQRPRENELVMRLEGHGSHLVAHHAEGGMKVSQAAN
jgi:hypothetical protein